MARYGSMGPWVTGPWVMGSWGGQVWLAHGVTRDQVSERCPAGAAGWSPCSCVLSEHIPSHSVPTCTRSVCNCLRRSSSSSGSTRVMPVRASTWAREGEEGGWAYKEREVRSGVRRTARGGGAGDGFALHRMDTA